MVTIDCPKSNEIISGRHYVVRISAAPCDKVEISIDGGTWEPCAKEAGSWWFRLNRFAPGEHRLAARVNIAGVMVCSLRRFEAGRLAGY